MTTEGGSEFSPHALAILEVIPNAIIVTDDSGHIEIFNLAAEPLFQYTAEELIGQHISLLLPALDVKRHIQPNVITELTAVRKGGARFPAEFSVGNMHMSGRDISACVITDISDRIRAEHAAIEAQDQLIEAEKMASLGGLVAGVAHEINTPVGIGVTASSHLRERYLSFMEEYQAGALRKPTLEAFLSTCDEATRILDTNLQRASDLIQSFKRIAVDQSSGDRRSFNICEYLHEWFVSMRPELKKTQLDVQLKCAGNLQINSFPGAISQVLTNLTMNSIIHAYNRREPGVLLITFEDIDDHYELVYCDDGKGIEALALQHIFEPFFTTRRGAGSSGLGMHIVYNLVTQTLDGKIQCDSIVGKGTRFSIVIPKND